MKFINGAQIDNAPTSRYVDYDIELDDMYLQLGDKEWHPHENHAHAIFELFKQDIGGGK